MSPAPDPYAPIRAALAKAKEDHTCDAVSLCDVCHAVDVIDVQAVQWLTTLLADRDALAARVGTLEQAIRHYQAVVQRVSQDQTWTWALNEMSDDVNTQWAEAFQEMMAVLNTRVEGP